MLLATQVQSILYHFLMGWVFAFGFSMLVTFKKVLRFSLIKAAMEFLYPIVFSMVMFYGLFHINGGIINIYLILTFLLGMMVYYKCYLSVFLQFFTGIRKFVHPIFDWGHQLKKKIKTIVKKPWNQAKKKRETKKKLKIQKKEEKKKKKQRNKK